MLAPWHVAGRVLYQNFVSVNSADHPRSVGNGDPAFIPVHKSVLHFEAIEVKAFRSGQSLL
jgi:hypothetical protein